jgi:hypothetical protein
MFCYFISDSKVKGIRMPDAGGVDLTRRVEQLGGFHYLDNTPHTYIGTKTQNPDRPTYRKKDRQSNRL